jgi:hypothetical protein
MAMLPDLTKFIFKVVYDKDEIIFPSTLGNLYSKFRYERYLLYKVHILKYTNSGFIWVPINMNFDIIKGDSSMSNMYFDMYGKRISIVKRPLDLEILQSTTPLQLKKPTLDSLSKLIFYFYCTKPPSKLQLMSTRKIHQIFDFNKANCDRSLSVILVKILRFIKWCYKETPDVVFRARILCGKMSFDLDKLITYYNEYCEYEDPLIKYNMINPIIDSVHTSLIYLNIDNSNRKPHYSTVYKQLNGDVFENEYKFVKKMKLPLVDINMYQIKGINSINGLVVYTKDCLLRMINAKR